MKSSTLCKWDFITLGVDISLGFTKTEAAGERQAQICSHSKIVPYESSLNTIKHKELTIYSSFQSVASEF